MFKGFICAFVLVWAGVSCQAQTQTGGAAKEIVERQVAPDLYFLYDETSSNSAFLITDEGVLVVDTRQHPRDGQDLLDRIRKITDKPVKWVVNTHFHGDHTYGNSVFKALGANIVAHEDTARIMAQVADKEFARRQPFFKARHYDPGEVKLTLPSLTFSKDLTIHLGGREVHLAYRGPGQNPGDTFVFFPHARAVFTSGAFGKRSMPNMNFTPSPENWVKLLTDVAKMDVDVVMPPHGDIATRADVTDLAGFINYEYATVKKAVADGVPLETAIATLDFSAYKDWHNYTRRGNDIKGLYELIQTGQRSYFK
ncbi:MBL fold metallo-hydrolase [Rhodoplanes sp. Z2-YC6860]|uniref:MBL fold metallo-hydrolase n=1 Tax=Rhodoplanes sp. Z2-YC6860 TaxID=674703 RepID=UPI00078C25F1|nr:MBL fold metallo-hydrolase [Rhodoplanes sp. Z2-YC6860]AMN41005.1 glyoxylase-related zinc-dependent hydrolase [Rhodoplanes sp. Z2-YC6860]